MSAPALITRCTHRRCYRPYAVALALLKCPKPAGAGVFTRHGGPGIWCRTPRHSLHFTGAATARRHVPGAQLRTLEKGPIHASQSPAPSISPHPGLLHGLLLTQDVQALRQESLEAIHGLPHVLRHSSQQVLLVLKHCETRCAPLFAIGSGPGGLEYLDFRPTFSSSLARRAMVSCKFLWQHIKHGAGYIYRLPGNLFWRIEVTLSTKNMSKDVPKVFNEPWSTSG